MLVKFLTAFFRPIIRKPPLITSDDGISDPQTTAEILFSGNVEGKYEFKHTWATVKGDKRAMDFTTKQLTNKNAEKPPEKDQMVYSALEKLIDNLYLEIKTSIQ